MRNPLNKRILRELKENLGRYIAISIMLIITISVLSGFMSNMESIKNGIKGNKISNKVEDGSFESYFQVNKEVLNKLETLGMCVYENYYKDEDVLNNSKLRLYTNRENIDIPVITKGNLPEEKFEIAIDRLFAKQNNLEVGSIITMNDENYKISGTTAFPDYTSLFEKNSNIMMDSIHFGVGLVTNDTLYNELNGNINYKYSYYFNDRSLSTKEKNSLTEEMEKIFIDSNIELKDFCTQENNQSISFIEEDMGSDEPMMKIFCYILIIIMAFVFTISIIAIIEDEAPIIGTLLANGYKKIEILSYYMKVFLIVTSISAVVGNMIGYIIMPNVFKNMYYNSYSLPDFNIKINFDAIITTTIIPICIMIVINLIFIAKKLSFSPLKFIRKDLKKTNIRKSIKLPKISFLKRFRIRVILQNKSSFLMLFIGILFGTMILVFGLSMQPILNKYIDDIEESSICKYQYILKDPCEVNVDNAEKFTISNLKLYFDRIDKDISVSFYGIKDNSKYIKGLDIDDNDEIYLSDGLMKKLKVKSGDSLTFKNPYIDDEYEFKVAGSYEYSGSLSVFMSEKSLNRILKYDKDYFNGYFSNTKLNIDDKYLASSILPEDMVKLGEQMTSSFGKASNICIFAAIIVYVALMYILTKIVIDKNALNISYMKVFGYNTKEIGKLYLNAATIFIIVSLIVQTPLVEYILKYIFELALLKMNGYIKVFVPWYIYILVICLGITSYIIINKIHMRNIYIIKMSEALKNRE